MKEIKFRAWDKETKTMVPFGFEDIKDNLFSVRELAFKTKENNPIMQYIGINDEDEKDIYEGDIVEGYGGIAVIEYDDHYEAGGCFYPKFTEESPESASEIWFEKLRWYRFKVIGNIYENSELLS